MGKQGGGIWERRNTYLLRRVRGGGKRQPDVQDFLFPVPPRHHAYVETQFINPKHTRLRGLHVLTKTRAGEVHHVLR